MSALQITQGIFHLSETTALKIPALTLRAGESWAFVGANGSGKSALARALCGEMAPQSGDYHSTFQRIARLSFEQLQQLVEAEWRNNNTDMADPEETDTGRTVAQIIQHDIDDDARCQLLAKQFGIGHLLTRRFKYLSTGETRKALLCQALMKQPDLLVLDEPFDGLDYGSRDALSARLADLHAAGITLALILNRFDDIPAFVAQAGVLTECALEHTGSRESLLAQTLIAQLAHSEKLATYRLPDADGDHALPDVNQPRVLLRNGTVTYDDRPILHGLNWCVSPGEHWQITGPNGAGKSTLLSLITGDHPQGYSNDLTLFGRRRGSGETIWDIKKHIGYVSSSLHLEYRVSASVLTVVLSGWHDSIGLYLNPGDRQLKLAHEWLALLGMDNQAAQTPFHALSWGQQRLVLIVRALVKRPALLILDEPLQGLDSLNRQLVRRFIDILIGEGDTQLLFVSHHAEDAPDCITHRLSFIPEGEGFRYQCDKLN